MVMKCLICGKDFKGKKGRKHCSRQCYSESMKLKTPWNKGLTKKEDARIGLQNVGSVGHAWNYGLKKGQDFKMCNFGKEKVRFEKSCVTCGKTITNLKAHAFKRRKYCNISCRPSWNKGLTKNNDLILQGQALKMKQMYVEGILDMHKLWDSQGRKPNKHEIILDAILTKFIPNEWKYVGDGKCWVTSGSKRMNPDFINSKRKKIIEYNGAYWHKYENNQDRIDLYKNIGYSCLIVEETELFNSSSELIKKLEEFTNG